MPAVATSVAYVDGVTGGNVFVMTLDGARNLAAAMMGMEQPEDPEAPELSELELSAVSEAMNQMMASAAIAISSVLGNEVEIGTPEPKFFTEQAAAVDAYAPTPHAVRANFTVCGEPCRLDPARAERVRRPHDDGARRARVRDGAADRAERRQRRRRGRTPRPAGPRWRASPSACGPSSAAPGCRPPRWSACRPGSVVELNQAADEPIDLYVNGTLFATGRLMVVDGTDWAVRIETVLSSSNASTESQMEVASMARVLVVDDAAFMRKMVSDALTKGGHEVVGEAGNGTEAIARFQELKPEVMTLDITMPEKDGLTALKEIIELDPSAKRDHVLGPGPGVQGPRVDQARRQGLRRQAVPG